MFGCNQIAHAKCLNEWYDVNKNKCIICKRSENEDYMENVFEDHYHHYIEMAYMSYFYGVLIDILRGIAFFILINILVDKVIIFLIWLT